MATTLATYAGKRVANYSHAPSLDVEILPDVHHCAEKDCGRVVTYVREGWSGGFRHEDGSTGHYVRPAPSCTYCHAEEGVIVKDYAWHTATECSRCGGSNGFALGD
jgi:hypothetical protein